MSGHSKWSNIKNKKGKTDAARGNAFTKIGREIAVAVKAGGPDPNSNARLRDVIAKARQRNMPNENINRSIKKASGESGSVNYSEILYEGYAAGGVAVMVETLTDNRNRTAGEMRYIFDRCGGTLGNNGCVAFLFKRKGLVVVDGAGATEDDVVTVALDAGAEDVVRVDEGDAYEVYLPAQDASGARDRFEEAGFRVIDSEIGYFADERSAPAPECVQNVKKLIEMLEENDDVQNVRHNAILDSED